MKSIIKGIGVLVFIGLLSSCGDDEVRPSAGDVISGFDYSVVPNADGDGTVVTLNPTSIGATTYEIDWGDGSGVTTVAAGNAAEHDYANPTTSEIADQTSEYLINVTAKGDGLSDSKRPLEVSITFDLDGDGVFGEDECPRFAAGVSPDDDRTGCPAIPTVAGVVSTQVDGDLISIFSDGVENPNFNNFGDDDFGIGYIDYSLSVSEANFFASAGEDTKFVLDAVPVLIGELETDSVVYKFVERDNSVLQYAFLDETMISFAPVDLTAANENVPNLTTLHLEAYSTEIDQLLITLFDSGSDESFEFDNQVITNGVWTSIDITLPIDLVDGNIDQIQIEVGTSGTATGNKTLYVDNVYLYK